MIVCTKFVCISILSLKWKLTCMCHLIIHKRVQESCYKFTCGSFFVLVLSKNLSQMLPEARVLLLELLLKYQVCAIKQLQIWQG